MRITFCNRPRIGASIHRGTLRARKRRQGNVGAEVACRVAGSPRSVRFLSRPRREIDPIQAPSAVGDSCESPSPTHRAAHPQTRPGMPRHGWRDRRRAQDIRDGRSAADPPARPHGRRSSTRDSRRPGHHPGTYRIELDVVVAHQKVRTRVHQTHLVALFTTTCPRASGDHWKQPDVAARKRMHQPRRGPPHPASAADAHGCSSAHIDALLIRPSNTVPVPFILSEAKRTRGAAMDGRSLERSGEVEERRGNHLRAGSTRTPLEAHTGKAPSSRMVGGPWRGSQNREKPAAILH